MTINEGNRESFRSDSLAKASGVGWVGKIASPTLAFRRRRVSISRCRIHFKGPGFFCFKGGIYASDGVAGGDGRWGE